MFCAEQIIEKIEEEKIIAIVRGVKKEKIIPLAQALFDGGIRLIECTYDASGRVSDEETASYIEMLVKHFGLQMLIGAGTVLTKKQVALTKKAGGTFIISPDTNKKIIKKTKAEGLVSIPGALTPSEIVTASKAGADFVKIFPINAFGSRYIKNIKAPLSNVKLLAVGGIDENNIGEYIDAGACGVGVATGVVNKKMIEADDFEGIKKLAENHIQKL